MNHYSSELACVCKYQMHVYYDDMNEEEHYGNFNKDRRTIIPEQDADS